MRMIEILKGAAEEHPYPLLFATVSGAHLYGFPSRDSDYDLRGAHVVPIEGVIGLERPEETVENAKMREGTEVDLVTHDIRKFFRLLLKPNGYVLEQLYSPHVVVSTGAYDELRQIARGCITRRHVRHYMGFARNQWRLFSDETPRRVKPLLYTFRVLLTGIHLMRTGEVEANLVRLNDETKLGFLDELLERKTSGKEQAVIAEPEMGRYEKEYQTLYTELQQSGEESQLPERPVAAPALNDLLIRVRLATANG